MKNELSHIHHEVKLSYYHSLYKRGGKIFIPHVLWDVILHTSNMHNIGEGDSFKAPMTKLESHCDMNSRWNVMWCLYGDPKVCKWKILEEYQPYVDVSPFLGFPCKIGPLLSLSCLAYSIDYLMLVLIGD